MNYHRSKGEIMPHYLNLYVVLRYDFIVTYLAIMFFIYWILAKIRLWRLSHVFRLVLQKRNRQIRRRRLWPEQKANRE
jgi:hypothetical protein